MPPLNAIAIGAAACLNPTGAGNDRTGFRPWPDDLTAALRRGRLAEHHWTTLFGGDPSRFARMDGLSQLAVVIVELLDAGFPQWPADTLERTAVCLETASGCIATDLQFLHTRRPSLFAYTLPSTALGELCIRHRLKGPQLCLLLPEPNASQVLPEAAHLLCTGQADRCLCVAVEALTPEAIRCLPPRIPETGAPAPEHAQCRAAALLLAPADAPELRGADLNQALADLARQHVAGAPND